MKSKFITIILTSILLSSIFGNVQAAPEVETIYCTTHDTFLGTAYDIYNDIIASCDSIFESHIAQTGGSHSIEGLHSKTSNKSLNLAIPATDHIITPDCFGGHTFIDK